MLNVSFQNFFHLNLDTREAGFVHAMTSASIIHKIASGCAQGTILDCHCDVKTKHFKTFHSNRMSNLFFK